jgi:membrane protein
MPLREDAHHLAAKAHILGERARVQGERALVRADDYTVPRVVVGILRELLSVDVRDRVFGLAGQSFLALIPVLILVSTAVSESDGESLAGLINERLDLQPPTTLTVLLLFSKPPVESTAPSVISVILLLMSINSFTRTMRRSMDRPWGLPRTNWHGQVTGLTAVALAICMHALLPAAGWVGDERTPWVLLGQVLLRTAVASLFWWEITYLLTHRRIPRRYLWPGAVAGGIAQSGASWWTATFLPTIIEKDAMRYGVIGVALSIVTWLIVMSAIPVGAGVIGAQVARAAGWIEPEQPGFVADAGADDWDDGDATGGGSLEAPVAAEPLRRRRRE